MAAMVNEKAVSAMRITRTRPKRSPSQPVSCDTVKNDTALIDQDMLDAVSNALALDRERRAAESELSTLRARYDSLTAREREVIALVTTGLMNKQIAGQLGVSEITVKIHRGHLMEKMGVRTLAELVKIYQMLRPERGI